MKVGKIISSLVLVGALMGCGSGVAYQDGTFRAQETEFHNGYQYFLEATVVNGKVTAVTWDAVAEDGTANKDAKSRAGEYGMVAFGGAKSEWHEQADAIKAYFLKTQDLKTPDAITGATIEIAPFFELAAKALKVAN